MKKLFLTVLYKCNISNSKTIKSFNNCGLFDSSNNYFVIWDNSPLPQEEVEIKKHLNKSNNYIYKHTPQNISLACIYNDVITNYKNIDYFIIFDQDSFLLDFNYEKILNKAIEDNKDIQLFLPRILTSKNVLYSPGRFIFPGKCRKIKKIANGINNSHNLSGITSGMVIKNEYFKTTKNKFNQNLKLYGIDIDFFINFSRSITNYYLLDYEITHDLSFESNEISEEEQWDRHCARIDALFLIYKHRTERFFIYLLKWYYLIRKRLGL
jgi:hypothetical protein